MSSSFTRGDGDGPRPTPPPSGDPQLPTDPAGLLVEQGRAGTDNPLAPSVTLAEIDRQRELGWPDFHPEEYCHRCGGRNPSSWWVDSDRFNMAFGPPAEHPYNGIVCPGCFVEAHEKATGMTVTWKLIPDPTIHFRWIDTWKVSP